MITIPVLNNEEAPLILREGDELGELTKERWIEKQEKCTMLDHGTLVMEKNEKKKVLWEQIKQNREENEFEKELQDILEEYIGKGYDFVISRKTFLSDCISSISCTASYLRAKLEKAEEFACSRPDEQGEFPFFIEIYAHWEASDMADLLVEADILLERLDNKIKLLPNADMLYERHLSSIASTQLILNPASSPSSSDTVQPQAPAQPAHVPFPQDRPSDPSSVAPVDHHPLASDAGTPQQGDQCPRAPSGFGNPLLTRSPAQTSMHPFGSQTPLPNPAPKPSFASTSGPSSSTSYSLRSFEIPFFSGDMDAFHEFWNIFAASAHNNSSVLVPVEFMYLKTHLKGDAANIIANFQPTEENYEDAVRTIISTYDRPEHLRMRLWDKLNKQAPAKDSAASQRATLGPIRAIWSQMKRFKEKSSTGALNMIRSKFPRRTREKVGEMKKKEDQMWTVDDLLTAFDTVIDRLQVVEDADPTPYAICHLPVLLSTKPPLRRAGTLVTGRSRLCLRSANHRFVPPARVLCVRRRSIARLEADHQHHTTRDAHLVVQHDRNAALTRVTAVPFV
ncbi:unnamed protein product [Cylicocyclus nassatus]|uniref:Uncharacterized protein n=1 Tax=Cylicocyclus nassatus TaxID=53992 RepID=A0AA36MGT7_CYLNA|nr:unnamed protein product [Cylicocyclus nassatus]